MQRNLVKVAWLVARPLIPISFIWTSVASGEVVKDQGLAMRAEPKYKPPYAALGYANPSAPKGGTLVIGVEGTVDVKNPYALKGDGDTEVQRLVFQELGESSLDEPFTQYPGLAEGFEVAKDQLSLTVKLRKEAVFSDGKPVTAADVVFSYETFKSDKVAPFYKFYWADIKRVEAQGDKTVKMVFAKVNPELPLIATQLPILPQHIYEKGDFSGQAIGSGPYILEDFKPGSAVTLKRNPNWWGKDLPVFKGRFNFDRIVIKYYKDPTAQVESFKKGDFDVYSVMSSKMWAVDLTGDKFERLKYIKKDLLKTSMDEGGQGFVFNLRNKIFSDIRVRKAIALAFDFAWSNKNLFYDQYQANESFFENSPLAARGMPTPEELSILTPLKADLEPEVFTQQVGYLGKGQDIKSRLRAGAVLLKEAGYRVQGGVAEGPAGRLEFKFLLNSAGTEKVVEPFLQNLKRIGIIGTIELKEQSVYVKRLENREFDMIFERIDESESPGNEQREFWSSQAADQNYSRNYAGVKNKAIDALVDQVIYAKSRGELELKTRCLDRALYHQHLLVHNWHLAGHRLAYWDKFGRPEPLPLYYSLFQLYDYLWLDPVKAKKLTDAKAQGVPLN